MRRLHHLISIAFMVYAVSGQFTQGVHTKDYNNAFESHRIDTMRSFTQPSATTTTIDRRILLPRRTSFYTLRPYDHPLFTTIGDPTTEATTEAHLRFESHKHHQHSIISSPSPAGHRTTTTMMVTTPAEHAPRTPRKLFHTTAYPTDAGGPYGDHHQAADPTTDRHHRWRLRLRADIKHILHLQPQHNATLDRILEHNFNLHTADPMYVFVLPGGSGAADDSSATPFRHNRTLVLHRSNFAQPAEFPRISPMQRRLQRTNITRLQQLIGNIERIRPSGDAPGGRLPDLDESESAVALRVVEENVRTERNFLHFMQLLNGNTDDDEAATLLGNSLGGAGDENDFEGRDEDEPPAWQTLLVGVPQIEYSLPYTTERAAAAGGGESTPAVSWKDLGLDGWLGGIKEPGRSFHQITQSHIIPESTSSSNRPQTAAASWPHDQTTTALRPKPTTASYHHFFSYQTTHQRPDATTTHAPKPNVNAWPPGGARRPRWPVTSPRAQHTDDDVFIGRANNPFGHSTRWPVADGNVSRQLPPTPFPSAGQHASNNNINGGGGGGRSKRGALLLYSMIKCATGCDPLMYKGYGCYCGFLGAGRPLDGIDRCCQAHDLCYVRASCPMFLEYFVPYLWKCYRGRPLCAIDHGEWGGPGSCASRLCECDQSLSKCLRRFYCPRKRAVCTSSPWRLLQNVIML